MVLKEKYHKRMAIKTKIMLLPNAVSLSRNTEWREEKSHTLKGKTQTIYDRKMKQFLKQALSRK